VRGFIGEVVMANQGASNAGESNAGEVTAE
jgi:hypothetical protein